MSFLKWTNEPTTHELSNVNFWNLLTINCVSFGGKNTVQINNSNSNHDKKLIPQCFLFYCPCTIPFKSLAFIVLCLCNLELHELRWIFNSVYFFRRFLLFLYTSWLQLWRIEWYRCCCCFAIVVNSTWLSKVTINVMKFKLTQ